jgi:hypothetical protein
MPEETTRPFKVRPRFFGPLQLESGYLETVARSIERHDMPSVRFFWSQKPEDYQRLPSYGVRNDAPGYLHLFMNAPELVEALRAMEEATMFEHWMELYRLNGDPTAYILICLFLDFYRGSDSGAVVEGDELTTMNSAYELKKDLRRHADQLRDGAMSAVLGDPYKSWSQSFWEESIKPAPPTMPAEPDTEPATESIEDSEGSRD